MAYTAENIANIKRDDKMAEYIAMERKLVADLNGALLVETKETDSSGGMSIAHLGGSYGAWEAVKGGKTVYEASAYCMHGLTLDTKMDKEWSNFTSLNAATQYARAALRNHLHAVAERVYVNAKERLDTLESAV